MEAAIQGFSLSLLTARLYFFHSAALPKFSKKLGREIILFSLSFFYLSSARLKPFGITKASCILVLIILNWLYFHSFFHSCKIIFIHNSADISAPEDVHDLGNKTLLVSGAVESVDENQITALLFFQGCITGLTPQ